MASDSNVQSLTPAEEDALRDRVFADERPQTDFKFNAATAKVFDDMVSRSVPFYGEMQRMTAEIVRDFAVEGSNLYDLGCSTATTLAALDPVLGPGVRFVGIDNSREMLDKAEEKLAALDSNRAYELLLADIHALPPIEHASAVVMNLTLQFVRPLHRERVVKQLYDGMLDKSVFVLIEKLTVDDSDLNRLFINYYYDMKRRNGYSEVEISQKREALENVLIPYRLDENIELLRGAGFARTEVFFRWYNFCGILAVK